MRYRIVLAFPALCVTFLALTCVQEEPGNNQSSQFLESSYDFAGDENSAAQKRNSSGLILAVCFRDVDHDGYGDPAVSQSFPGDCEFGWVLDKDFNNDDPATDDDHRPNNFDAVAYHNDHVEHHHYGTDHDNGAHFHNNIHDSTRRRRFHPDRAGCADEQRG